MDELSKKMLDAKLQGLTEMYRRLDNLRPSQQNLRGNLLLRLQEIDPKLQTIDENIFETQWLRPPKDSVLWKYKELYADIGQAADPYIEIEDCIEGVLYKVRCRNSNCGIWIPEEKSFQIARTKFESTYLFEEVHYDASTTYGTAKPYEILEELPLFRNDEERLQYLLDWRDKLGSY